jgi:protein-L-isoaspartate(D-aspartate) O-methyltransferase
MFAKYADVFHRVREMMVEFDIHRRGIRSKNVSMKSVPRHLFVDPPYQMDAYNDHPLPIGYGQTISQPFVVALMAEAAQIGKNDKVLEVGTGSGYSAAVLANLAKEVYTIENIPELAEAATARLFSLGYNNVHVKHGDGSVGWPEAGPFDAIIVTAAAPKVPPSLKVQLKPLGRLVIPVAAQDSGALGEALMRVTKIPSGGGFSQEYLTGVRFVPLVGKEGFPQPEEE